MPAYLESRASTNHMKPRFVSCLNHLLAHSCSDTFQKPVTPIGPPAHIFPTRVLDEIQPRHLFSPPHPTMLDRTSAGERRSRNAQERAEVQASFGLARPGDVFIRASPTAAIIGGLFAEATALPPPGSIVHISRHPQILVTCFPAFLPSLKARTLVFIPNFFQPSPFTHLDLFATSSSQHFLTVQLAIPLSTSPWLTVSTEPEMARSLESSAPMTSHAKSPCSSAPTSMSDSSSSPPRPRATSQSD